MRCLHLPHVLEYYYTLIGGQAQKESIIGGTDASAYNRSFFCMEATIKPKRTSETQEMPPKVLLFDL